MTPDPQQQEWELVAQMTPEDQKKYFLNKMYTGEGLIVKHGDKVEPADPRDLEYVNSDGSQIILATEEIIAELEHKKRVAWFTSLPEKTKKRIARRHKKGYKNPKGYFL